MKEYKKESWIDPRIEVRDSGKGRGMFATAPIGKGETVSVWGGTVFTEEEKAAGLIKKYTASRLDAHHWLGSKLDEPYSDDIYLNHSCDPNTWLTDEVTLVARRDIAPGEEITADYATWSIDENWVMDEPCRCGSPLCRHTITGNDWKLKEVQDRYQGHFVPYINELIEQGSL
ncbi:MAG: SET domain-containing protein [Patescibacteria group bacterium]|nr:SET domain-containing protein-lysine N-methyltransferase [Patescibacteria group bacterium]MDE1965662.1 SET domain-containing protein [Patescibacteria group bacterium]